MESLDLGKAYIVTVPNATDEGLVTRHLKREAQDHPIVVRDPAKTTKKGIAKFPAEFLMSSIGGQMCGKDLMRKLSSPGMRIRPATLEDLARFMPLLFPPH